MVAQNNKIKANVTVLRGLKWLLCYQPIEAEPIFQKSIGAGSGRREIYSP